MGKTRNILALVLVAIIGSIIFWKRDWIKERIDQIKNPKSSAEEPEQNAVIQPPLSPSVTPEDKYKFPLKLGSSGKTVKSMQNALNRRFNANIAEDGYFGTATEAALVKAGFGKELETSEVVKLMV
ncbi:MAG: hypothetical protein C0596_07410 [Marinilabiliales bacterium]|nr:MAG: hypothetical protein C0596_07410 [Marinilabiliales bacterium]